MTLKFEVAQVFDQSSCVVRVVQKQKINLKMKFSLVTVILAILLRKSQALNCYGCEVMNETDTCKYSYTCDSQYCETLVSKIEGETSITMACGSMDHCMDRTEASGLEKCNLTDNDTECFTCCEGDKCNELENVYKTLPIGFLKAESREDEETELPRNQTDLQKLETKDEEKLMENKLEMNKTEEREADLIKQEEETVKDLKTMISEDEKDLEQRDAFYHDYEDTIDNKTRVTDRVGPFLNSTEALNATTENALNATVEVVTVNATTAETTTEKLNLTRVLVNDKDFNEENSVNIEENSFDDVLFKPAEDEDDQPAEHHALVSPSSAIRSEADLSLLCVFVLSFASRAFRN